MNASKKKGTDFESQVVLPFIKIWKPEAERRTLAGNKDKGDIYIPGEKRFVLELKCHKDMKLAAWVEEARVEAGNAGVPFGVVIHKRRGTRTPGEQYVTMPLFAFLGLVYGEPPEPGNDW